jgi:hypothetical protein
MVLYLCALIVFSLHRESLKLILAMNPSVRWFCHRQPTVESLGEFPIFLVGDREIRHETLIALPCLGESLICRLLEAHPRISSVALLADLSVERSQKSY